MGRAPLAESAQALRPVDPSKSVRDIRGETARDKPVGPPPSFDVNVLQDMRETLRDPVDKPNAGEGDNIPQRREVEESEMAYGKSSQAASDPELNRKI